MRADEFITEYRKGPMRQIRQQMPGWPEYVIKDMIYKKIKNSEDLKTHQNWFLEKAQQIENWEFERGMMLNMSMMSPATKSMMRTREFGDKNIWNINKDEERMINAYDIVKQKGMENLPPIIMIKTPAGYDLWEGWHRTMAAFKLYPGGFKVNAYIGYPTDEYYGNRSQKATADSYGRRK